VPLSTTAPDPIEAHHHRLRLEPELPPPYEGPYKWVKGDMLYTMSFERLSRPHAGKHPATGKRQYLQLILEPSELLAVESCVRAALGLSC